MDLERCGLPKERRFSFFDQVHTTGMDIPQGASARAVLTLGKDLTFRDYAQGAYRMRGIGKGQTIVLFVIPEVQRLCLSETAMGAGMGPDALQARRAALPDEDRQRSELEGVAGYPHECSNPHTRAPTLKGVGMERMACTVGALVSGWSARPARVRQPQAGRADGDRCSGPCPLRADEPAVRALWRTAG